MYFRCHFEQIHTKAIIIPKNEKRQTVGIRNEEGNNEQGSIWNNDDGQTADVLAQKTLKKKTYAAVARRSSHCVRTNDRMKKSERRQF